MRCACLLPVIEEWVEVVACEIHHGEEHVLVVLAEPELRVLPDGMVAVPSARAVSARIAIFAYGRTAQFDPWLDRFDELVNGGLLADSLQKIPFSDGKSFDINVSTQISKTGKTIPLLECSASYNDYLKGLDSNAVKQLNEEANKTGSFPGLKIGDLDTPNRKTNKSE